MPSPLPPSLLGTIGIPLANPSQGSLVSAKPNRFSIPRCQKPRTPRNPPVHLGDFGLLWATLGAGLRGFGAGLRTLQTRLRTSGSRLRGWGAGLRGFARRSGGPRSLTPFRSKSSEPGTLQAQSSTKSSEPGTLQAQSSAVTGGAVLCPAVYSFGWSCAHGHKKRKHSVQACPEARPRSPTVRPTVRNAGLSPASQQHEATKNEPAETRIFFARSGSVRVDRNNPQG